MSAVPVVVLKRHTIAAVCYLRSRLIHKFNPGQSVAFLYHVLHMVCTVYYIRQLLLLFSLLLLMRTRQLTMWCMCTSCTFSAQSGASSCAMRISSSAIFCVTSDSLMSCRSAHHVKCMSDSVLATGLLLCYELLAVHVQEHRLASFKLHTSCRHCIMCGETAGSQALLTKISRNFYAPALCSLPHDL